MQFQWRFSKEDRHHKQAKKSLKAKINAREKQRAEEKQESEVMENARNSETRFSNFESSLQFQVISDHQVAGIEDGRTEVLAHKDLPLCENEVPTEGWNTDHKDDQDIGNVCLDLTSMHENCEDQMLQEHCHGNFEAETIESNLEAGCQSE